MSDDSYITERYIELVRQIGDAMDYAHGWKASAAERLGISPSYLSKILHGQRTVGFDVANRAAKSLGIDPSLLTGASPLPPLVSAEKGPHGLRVLAPREAPEARQGMSLREVQVLARYFLHQVIEGASSPETATNLARSVLGMTCLADARAALEAPDAERVDHATRLAVDILGIQVPEAPGTIDT